MFELLEIDYFIEIPYSPLCPFFLKIGAFFTVAPVFASIFFTIIDKYLLEKTTGKFPYEEARLVATFRRVSNCCEAEIDEYRGKCEKCKRRCRVKVLYPLRPYVEFKVWNEVTGQLERKREYAGLSKCKTAQELRTVSNLYIKEINTALKEGYHIQGEADPEPIQDLLTVKDAFKYVMAVKKRETAEKSYYKFEQIERDFFDFLNRKYPYMKNSIIQKITEKEVSEFYDYIDQIRPYAPKTRSTYRVMFKSFFSCLIDNKKIKINPCPKNKFVSPSSTKNIAFNKVQIAKLKEVLQEKDPELLKFVTWMFYTLARPRKELRLMKVKFIDLEKEKIKIIKQRSKNRLERTIEVSPHLLPLIQELQIENMPPDWYIFGTGGKPGPSPAGVNFYYNRMKKILKDLEYPPEYTLYSWKHSGVSYHYLAGVDIMALKEQTGHEDLESFIVYLKSLGLIDNTRFKNNSPAF